MGVIYVNGGYKSTSGLTKIHTINKIQDERLEKLESFIEDDENIDNPDVLNAKIIANSNKIRELEERMDIVEPEVRQNTITIDGITVNLDKQIKDVKKYIVDEDKKLDNEIDELNEKINSLTFEGLKWQDA